MIYAIALTTFLAFSFPQQNVCNLIDSKRYNSYPEYLIDQYADNPEVVKRIAICESDMGKYRKNLQGSSAEGLLQFMPRTFKANCEGDIKSDKDQIICFNKLYPKYPNYWICK